MVSINYAFKEIISKIVYYGPGLSGKTTNLQYVFAKVPKDTRGELISLATDADRTLYFDFLPVNVGTIRGFATKFQLYTVPGQVYYNATRKLVLRGVDGLVFVADSQIEKMDDNIESLNNLEENLTEYGYDIHEMPLVMQYNKRDLPNVATIEQLQKSLNPKNLPYFEAVATTGVGIFGTLKAISKMVLDKARNDTPEKSKKPEPVVVSVQSPSMAEEIQSEKITTISESVSAILEKPIEPIIESESKIESTIEEIRQQVKPNITGSSEGTTNVVVSSSPEEGEIRHDHSEKNELEETTEHSILKEESYVPAIEPVIKKHPAILDADKLSLLYKRLDNQDKPYQNSGFDEEATQISESNSSPQVLSKPHMAESTKVKAKKKAGLFGWLKKK